MVSREGFSPADVLGAISAVSGAAPQIIHRINDYATVAALVAAGDVIGIIPRYTAGAAVGEAVVLRPLEGIANRRRIDLLARPESMHRRSVQLVAAAMAQAMAELDRRRGSGIGRVTRDADLWVRPRPRPAIARCRGSRHPATDPPAAGPP